MNGKNQFDPSEDGFSFINDDKLKKLAYDVRAQNSPSREEVDSYTDQMFPPIRAFHGITHTIPPTYWLSKAIVGLDGLCYGMSATAIDYYLDASKKPVNARTSDLAPQDCIKAITGAQTAVIDDPLRATSYVRSILSSYAEDGLEKLPLLGGMINGARRFLSIPHWNTEQLTILIKSLNESPIPRIIIVFDLVGPEPKSFVSHAIVATKVVKHNYLLSHQISVYDPNRGARTEYVYVDKDGNISPTQSLTNLGYKVAPHSLRYLMVFK